MIAITKKTNPTYTIEVDEKTAMFLLSVVRCIGGDPHKSRRRHADDLQEALQLAKVPVADNSDVDGRILFKEKLVW